MFTSKKEISGENKPLALLFPHSTYFHIDSNKYTKYTLIFIFYTLYPLIYTRKCNRKLLIYQHFYLSVYLYIPHFHLFLPSFIPINPYISSTFTITITYFSSILTSNNLKSLINQRFLISPHLTHDYTFSPSRLHIDNNIHKKIDD